MSTYRLDLQLSNGNTIQAGTFEVPTAVQTTGQSTVNVMSQKAVTDAVLGTVIYDKDSDSASLNWGYPNGISLPYARSSITTINQPMPLKPLRFYLSVSGIFTYMVEAPYNAGIFDYSSNVQIVATQTASSLAIRNAGAVFEDGVFKIYKIEAIL